MNGASNRYPSHRLVIRLPGQSASIGRVLSETGYRVRNLCPRELALALLKAGWQWAKTMTRDPLVYGAALYA